MKEVLDSLTTTLRERLVSPLAGAFIVSWLIINYKVVVVLTSGMKPHVKFPYIEDFIWRDSYGLWMNCLVYPAIAALLYILIYPWPARWLLKYSLYQQNITKRMKIEAEDNYPVTREELVEARQKWTDKYRAQGEKIQRLEIQLEDEQKKSEEFSQAEQKMAARADQLAFEFEMAKTENTKALEGLGNKISDLNVVLRERDEKIFNLEREAEALKKSLEKNKKISADSVVQAVLDNKITTEGRGASQYALVSGIINEEANPAVVRVFIIALNKYFKVEVAPTKDLIDRLMALIKSFSRQDSNVFWRQIGSVEVNLDEYSSQASEAIRNQFFS